MKVRVLIACLLSAMSLTPSLMAQIPASPIQTGSVSGVVRTATGAPAVGIRVTAMRADAMDDALGMTPPGSFRLALYANVTATPVTDPTTERDLLVQQVTGRVRWRESVIAMKAAGIERFVELGGKVVGPMIGRTVEDVLVTSVITMADIEALAKEL